MMRGYRFYGRAGAGRTLSFLYAGGICLGVIFLFLFFGPGRNPGPSAFERINDTDVFLKQEEPSSCTLCAAAMMLRRAALLSGDVCWKRVTEDSLRKEAWIEGQGLRHSFIFRDKKTTFRVEHDTLPGGEKNRDVLLRILKQHPEGIVLYCGPGENQHAVLLTDTVEGIFYCADPCQGILEGRIPLEEAFLVTPENADAFWYVVF